MSSVTIRRASTDDDLAATRRVQMAVFPNEMAQTVEQMRANDGPDKLRLIAADENGTVTGIGTAARSGLTGGAVVAPVVLPEHRRRGIGAQLLRALVVHAEALRPDFLVGHADDEGSRAFAERFGFVEVDRQVEQVRRIGDEPPAPTLDGVAVVTVAERPELWDVAYDRVGLQAFTDMAVITPVQVTREEWHREWMTDPAAMFLALPSDGSDEVIGLAGLLVDPDEPTRAENALTAVRREWRGRGVAAALKRTTLHHAATHGIAEVYTWTQKNNADMRRLNERLGYVTRQQSFTMRATPPLTV
jgi:mycothiol synthase